MGCSTKYQALEWQQQLCLDAVTGLANSIFIPILPKGIVGEQQLGNLLKSTGTDPKHGLKLMSIEQWLQTQIITLNAR